MTKLDILKKLNLIKHVDTNGLNGDKYYKTNRKNPLFWVIYVLLAILLAIPHFLVAMYYSVALSFETMDFGICHIFEIHEPGENKKTK